MFARIHPAALAGVFVLAAPITCTSDGQASHTAPKPPQYGTPSNLGIAINSDGFDGGPSISADALTIYFISDRAGGSGGGDIWSATRPTTADAFANPKNLGPVVNSARNEGAPDISTDGLELFFDRDDGLIWRSSRPSLSDSFGNPALVELQHDPQTGDAHPSISADGLDLYFCTARPGGSGGDDIWVAPREGPSKSFGPPRNLGPSVNSPADDCEPGPSSDGRLLFFASDRLGGSGRLDIWVSTRASRSDPYGGATNLGPALNSFYMDETPEVSADGTTLYFMSNRPGGSGFFDIWQAHRT
ncbi:MAG TPA: hypothetical protein VGK42_13270 [Candidatus Dormibacteraeota bacterium]